MGTNKVATVIILDVSKSMNAVSPEDGKTYFGWSKWVLSRIILRKIFAGETDELGLVLMGSERTENRLAGQLDNHYCNIVEFQSIRLPSWDLYDKVRDIEMSNETTVDWAEALALSIQIIKEETEGRKFRDKQIVFLSNFKSEKEVSGEILRPLQSVVSGLNIKIVVIGVSLQEDSVVLPRVVGFVDKLSCGVVLSFREAYDQFKFYEKKRKMKRLTKMVLLIGEEIKIPMKWMKVSIDETRFNWSIPMTCNKNICNPSTEARQAPSASAVKASTEPDYDDGNEIQFVVEDRKKTYFGATEVILNYADLEALKRQTGPPSMTFLGAVKSRRISRAMLISDQIYILVPDTTTHSYVLCSALIEALLSQNKYGLVRRVASMNGKVHLGILYPVSDELGKALYFLKLPFNEWIKSVPYIPLPEAEDSKLASMIDDVIESMSLVDLKGHDILLREPNFQMKCDLFKCLKAGEPPVISPDIRDTFFHPYENLKSESANIFLEMERLYPIDKPHELLGADVENVKEDLLESSKSITKELTEEQLKDIEEIKKAVESEFESLDMDVDSFE